MITEINGKKVAIIRRNSKTETFVNYAVEYKQIAKTKKALEDRQDAIKAYFLSKFEGKEFKTYMVDASDGDGITVTKVEGTAKTSFDYDACLAENPELKEILERYRKPGKKSKDYVKIS